MRPHFTISYCDKHSALLAFQTVKPCDEYIYIHTHTLIYACMYYMHVCIAFYLNLKYGPMLGVNE